MPRGIDTGGHPGRRVDRVTYVQRQGGSFTGVNPYRGVSVDRSPATGLGLTIDSDPDTGFVTNRRIGGPAGQVDRRTPRFRGKD